MESPSQNPDLLAELQALIQQNAAAMESMLDSLQGIERSLAAMLDGGGQTESPEVPAEALVTE